MNSVKSKQGVSGWILDCVLTHPDGNDRWARQETPDEVANLLVEIVEKYNKTADKYGEAHYGVMDFEDEWLVFSPEADSHCVKLEDIPSFCSYEWVEKHSIPAI